MDLIETEKLLIWGFLFGHKNLLGRMVESVTILILTTIAKNRAGNRRKSALPLRISALKSGLRSTGLFGLRVHRKSRPRHHRTWPTDDHGRSGHRSHGSSGSSLPISLSISLSLSITSLSFPSLSLSLISLILSTFLLVSPIPSLSLFKTKERRKEQRRTEEKRKEEEERNKQRRGACLETKKRGRKKLCVFTEGGCSFYTNKRDIFCMCVLND